MLAGESKPVPSNSFATSAEHARKRTLPNDRPQWQWSGSVKWHGMKLERSRSIPEFGALSPACPHAGVFRR
jgi:hypothetical protein